MVCRQEFNDHQFRLVMSAFSCAASVKGGLHFGRGVGELQLNVPRVGDLCPSTFIRKVCIADILANADRLLTERAIDIYLVFLCVLNEFNNEGGHCYDVVGCRRAIVSLQR